MMIYPNPCVTLRSRTIGEEANLLRANMHVATIWVGNGGTVVKCARSFVVVLFGSVSFSVQKGAKRRTLIDSLATMIGRCIRAGWS